jgi:hypothetical protein
MPSSISSSETQHIAHARDRGAVGLPQRPPPTHDRYARQTAADRPGIAQPVPSRPVPEHPWSAMLLAAVVLLAPLIGGWEWYWRDYGVRPSIANTYGLWAIQRRRIDAGEGDATVLVGGSRMYFDMQLPVWERLEGRRPIQLSFEGTSPLAAVEDLAADPKFTGRLVIAVEPDLLFSGFAYRGGAIAYARKESPSQRIGQWLSMHVIEPYFAFDDPDYALQTVLARQPWPRRPGRIWFKDVRKLSETEVDRNTHLWSKVATDAQYRQLARDIWHQDLQPGPDDPTPEEALKTENEQIGRMAKAVATLRARGVKVLFVRMPSDGEYLEAEDRMFPRARSWNALLKATGAAGIYFKDYPQLQGYYLPEWSHMTRSEGERFTAELYRIIVRDYWSSAAAAVANGVPTPSSAE